MTITNMTSEHVSQVAELEKLCFGTEAWSEKSVASELTNRLSLWLVALDGERVSGYVGSQSVLGESDMMNVAVHPDYRRQGIAEKLCLALVEALQADALAQNDEGYEAHDRLARYLADVTPQKATIMTQCFAESHIGAYLRERRRRGYDIKVLCPETRPYFQGARLTASVAKDMGFDVTVITDNMPGYTMREKQVDLFTSAADVITMDGHIINKVGTFQIALCASYWGIPYYVTGAPNPSHPDLASVTIEQRDPELVLDAMGTKTTLPGVKGYYPAFDVTPPKLCDGVVTEKGVFAPTDLKRYFE